MPITEKTISFIGKPNELVANVAKYLAAYNYRLLFCGSGSNSFKTLQQSIRQQHPSIKAKDMDDSYCSCWEADVVFLSAGCETNNEFLNTVQPVVANKVMVSVEACSASKDLSTEVENRAQRLQQFLPYSRVVAVTSLLSNEKDDYEKNVLITGEDKKAVDEVSKLLEAVGFDPGTS